MTLRISSIPFSCLPLPSSLLPSLLLDRELRMEAREERNEGNGKACHLIPFPILWFLKLCLGERESESRLEGGERMDTSFGHRTSPSIPYSPSLSLSLSHSFPSPPTSARTWRLKMGGDRV